MSIFVRPRADWLFTTNEIDYYLSSNKLDQKSTGSGRLIVGNYKKIICYFPPSDWSRHFSSYTAIGDEEYLIIGFINPDYKIFQLSDAKPPLNKEIYLFIDEVSLVPDSCGHKRECSELNIPKSESNDFGLGINKPLVLKNINFESGKAKLLPASNEELNKLVLYLKSNSSYKIEISGHTDNIGNEDDNKILSQERVKALANYLITAGIDGKRITYKGNGSQIPLKPNDTEENRLLNRRVEIKLIK